MMRLNGVIVSLISLFFLTSVSQASVEQHFQTLRHNRHALYSFIKAMPKGGELHFHFDGAAYAETMLQLSTKTGVCLDAATMTSRPCTKNGKDLSVSDVLKQKQLFHKAIQSWSMKDFKAENGSAYEHFHSIFPKLFLIQSKIKALLLASILHRAGKQHELYLELITFGLPDDDRYAKLIHDLPTYEQKKSALLADPSFQDQIQATVLKSQTLLSEARSILHCTTHPNRAGCQVDIRFQAYVRRVKPIDSVFAQALAGFVAATRSKTIVGVNLVDVEDRPIAQQDYEKQMHIFDYLHQQYPNVHITLHAGELFPQARVPHLVKSPIRDAILVGHAERIGHGLDLSEEPDPAGLGNLMAKHAIAIEVNLISNKLVFGIEGPQHPLAQYLKYHVPVVLSTDDEGMLRTSLSKEYLEAAEHQNLDYPTLKQINRNSLTYGFISGKSLWQDPEKAITVPDCQVLNSSACKAFIKNNPKASLQWHLEQALLAFESQYN